MRERKKNKIKKCFRSEVRSVQSHEEGNKKIKDQSFKAVRNNMNDE